MKVVKLFLYYILIFLGFKKKKDVITGEKLLGIKTPLQEEIYYSNSQKIVTKIILQDNIIN